MERTLAFFSLIWLNFLKSICPFTSFFLRKEWPILPYFWCPPSQTHSVHHYFLEIKTPPFSNKKHKKRFDYIYIYILFFFPKKTFIKIKSQLDGVEISMAFRRISPCPWAPLVVERWNLGPPCVEIISRCPCAIYPRWARGCWLGGLLRWKGRSSGQCTFFCTFLFWGATCAQHIRFFGYIACYFLIYMPVTSLKGSV